MSHPKRADHFKKWAAMMLEQALVPERLEYKGGPSKGSSSRKSAKRMNKRSMRRRKRFLRRKRKQQD